MNDELICDIELVCDIESDERLKASEVLKIQLKPSPPNDLVVNGKIYVYDYENQIRFYTDTVLESTIIHKGEPDFIPTLNQIITTVILK